MSSRRCLYVAIAGVLGAALLVVVFQQPLLAHVRTFLFLSQELPQSPIRPLHLFTRAPDHQQLHLESQHGGVVADLFVPTGFRAAEPASLPRVWCWPWASRSPTRTGRSCMSFAETLARLGFVVVFPRLEALDQGVSLPEEPATFVAGVRILQSVPQVDPERISLLGISIGASTALVAASSPELADDVHAMIFFGGFHDVFDYLVSLASGTMLVDGEPVAVGSDPEAVGHMRQILENKGATHLLSAFDTESRAEAERVIRSAPGGDSRSCVGSVRPPARAAPTRACSCCTIGATASYRTSSRSGCATRCRPNRSTTSCCRMPFSTPSSSLAALWEALSDLGDLYGFVTNALGYLDR